MHTRRRAVKIRARTVRSRGLSGQTKGGRGKQETKPVLLTPTIIPRYDRNRITGAALTGAEPAGALRGRGEPGFLLQGGVQTVVTVPSGLKLNGLLETQVADKGVHGAL